MASKMKKQDQKAAQLAVNALTHVRVLDGEWLADLEKEIKRAKAGNHAKAGARE